ncbi:MAG: substrate-binding domain-containing protein, partial [Christensenellales bacterium]
FVSALLNNNITINNEFLLGDVEYINKYIKKTAFQRLKFFSDYNDILVEKYYSLDEKPDVICCASDNDALNLTDAFLRRDKKLPDDLIITGFDNMNYKLLENCNTVEQNFYEIGKVAIETALKLLNGEKVEKLTEIDAKIIIKNKK